MALRIIGLSCGLLLAANLSLDPALAGGRGGGAGPRATSTASIHHPEMRAFRSNPRAARADFRRGRHHRWAWGGPGYVDHWLFYPPGSSATVAVIAHPAEPAPPVDADSFENLTARAGMRRGPPPEPTIYRLEGPRLRPAARVIRIGAAEPAGRRTRYAHAETGALLLTVPRR